MMRIRLLYILLIFFSCSLAFAQFPPAVGNAGTTAMHKDSSAFIGWASYCTIQRGYINLADTSVTYNGVTITMSWPNLKPAFPVL